MDKTLPTKFFLYARKSTEDDDRQVLSIDSQIAEIKKLAIDKGLKVLETLTESKSAKSPGRPVFNEMISRIHAGEAQGVLCWKLDRLARNPVDGGQISWMLQQGVIHQICTFGRDYYPSDNVLMMQVEFGMANQFIRDLSVGVKRGLRKKIEMGWNVGVAPAGYLNTPDREKGYKIVIKDPERFHLVRKMWDLMLTGVYSPPKILEIANNEWGYRTPRRRKVGGVPMSLSGIYRIFYSKFYAGILTFKGQEHRGSHEAMISLDEYDRVQSLLSRGAITRPKKLLFAYSGLIRCAECGCVYTAQTKTKFIKCEKVHRSYTYYNCTRKKKYVRCTQRSSIREETINEQVEQEISKITIPELLKDWAIEMIEKYDGTERENNNKIRSSKIQALEQAQKEFANLTGLRCRDLIDDDLFAKQSAEIKSTIMRLQIEIEKESKNQTEIDLEPLKETFEFAAYALKAFIGGDIRTKRDILSALGQNYAMKDGKLYISKHPHLEPLERNQIFIKSFASDFARLEPTEIISTKGKDGAINPAYSQTLPN